MPPNMKLENNSNDKLRVIEDLLREMLQGKSSINKSLNDSSFEVSLNELSIGGTSIMNSAFRANVRKNITITKNNDIKILEHIHNILLHADNPNPVRNENMGFNYLIETLNELLMGKDNELKNMAYKMLLIIAEKASLINKIRFD